MTEIEKASVLANFTANIARARSLIEIYDLLPGAGDPGRPSNIRTDALRAAIVFLHAALEDLIRTSSEYLLPLADRETLEEIGLRGSDKKLKKKVTLGYFAQYRGKSVDEVLRQAVLAHLEGSNYGSVNEVIRALGRIKVASSVLDPNTGDIEAIMRRRHQIVHRADKVSQRSPARGTLLSTYLSKATANSWVNTIADVGTRIGDALPVSPSSGV